MEQRTTEIKNFFARFSGYTLQAVANYGKLKADISTILLSEASNEEKINKICTEMLKFKSGKNDYQTPPNVENLNSEVGFKLLDMDTEELIAFGKTFEEITLPARKEHGIFGQVSDVLKSEDNAEAKVKKITMLVI